MRKRWKHPQLLGNLAYYAIRGLGCSLKITTHKHHTIDPDRPYIFAFWHGKQILPSLALRAMHNTPMCAMISPSRDGSILVAYINKIGFEAVRGSSRDKNIAALIRMKNKLLSGASIGTAIDGPIGPIHVVKPGLIFLAQKYNVPIIPMNCASDRFWVFQKAWDKFELPKPFSKNALVLGEPFVVDKNVDVQQACLQLADRLQQVEHHAKALIAD